MITVGIIVRIGIIVCFLLFLMSATPLWGLYVMMFIAGCYNCQHSVTISTPSQIQFRPELRVQGNSVIQLAQNLGSAVGIAVFTLVIGLFGIVDGMRVAFILAIITAAIALSPDCS